MTALNVFLVVLGGLVLLYTRFVKPLQVSFLTEPMISLFVGILLGPAVTGVFAMVGFSFDQVTLLEQSSRLALAIGLMGSALRIPSYHFLDYGRSVAFLIVVIMPLMFIVSGIIVWGVFGLPLWLSLLIGAVITPTDPVLATTITTGPIAREKIPTRIRAVLSAESGLNDGLAYPLIFLPILAVSEPPPQIAFDWLVKVMLWQVVGAAVLGGILGYLAGRMLRAAERDEGFPQVQVFPYTVALALLSLGAAKLIGTDGVLAVFLSGIFFSVAYRGRLHVLEEESEGVVARFFFTPAFLFLGMTIPWNQWLALGWRAIALLVGILLLRRLPEVLALRSFIRDVKDTPDALFVGWFGPIGVSAIFYAAFAAGYVDFDQVWPISSLVIVASTIVFGLTARPFTEIYDRLRGGRRSED